MANVVIFAPIADQPAASVFNSGFFFWATDTDALYLSDGSTWNDIGGGGGGAVASVFGRTGAVVAVDADYYGVVAAALTGATAASRYAGATTGGAPVTGAFLTGDFVIDQTGTIWICTASGSPGTWIGVSAGGLPAWFQSGSGSPVGAVVPNQINAIYVDIDAATPGGFYKALGATNTDWVGVGGFVQNSVVGMSADATDVRVLALGQGEGGGQATISDTDGILTGFGIAWNGVGATVGLAGGGSLLVLDSSGNPIFRVDDDATVHIKTGQTIQADL